MVSRYKFTRAVQVTVKGRPWTGQWQLDGDDLVLASAWGCARERLGRKDPYRLAERLMLKLARHYVDTGQRLGCG